MAISFPALPTNGQTYTSGVNTYTYNGVKGLWSAGATAAPASSSSAGRQGASLPYIYLAENKGILNIANGIVDPFDLQTSIDAVASANETYNAGGSYSPTVITTIMTLQSIAFTATTSPTTAIIGIRTTGVFTANTDVTAEISCDGGLTWGLASIGLVDTLPDGSAYYEDLAVDLSTLTGVSIKYRIKVLNSKNIPISTVFLQWA